MSDNAKKAASMLKRIMPNFVPRIGMVLGSGLGAVSEQIENSVVFNYDELPGFTVSHVEGHASKLHLGMLKGVPVVCFEGRAHMYEGTKEAIAVLRTVIRTFRLLGGEILLTTNAAGSLRPEAGPGYLVLVKDHINFMFSHPLIGRNDDEFGDRFVAMDDVYDAKLRKMLRDIAQKKKIPFIEGVYLGNSGPTYETHAEVRAYKILGADVVGMSTVPEVIIARHCGLKIATVSYVVNLAAGMSDEIPSHDMTLKNAKLAVDNVADLFLTFVEELGNKR